MMKAGANGNFSEVHILNGGSSGGVISLVKYNCDLIIVMKNLTCIGISCFLFFSACRTHKGLEATPPGNSAVPLKDSSKQSVSDSLQYRKSILDNKEKYINKEFGNLIRDLRLPIKSYTSDHINMVLNSGIMISFDDWRTTQNKSFGLIDNKEPVRLFIEWSKPLPLADVVAGLKRAGGEWRTDEQNFYSKLIIKDIR